MIKGTLNRTTNLFVLLIVISFIFPATAIRYAQAASTTVITNQPNAKTFTCTDPTGKNLFCHPRIHVTTNFVQPKNPLTCKDADNHKFKCTYIIIYKKGTHTPTAVLLDVYVTPKDKQLLYENKIKVVSFFVTKLVVKVIHEHKSNGKVRVVAIVEEDHNNRPTAVVINCFAPCLQQEYSRAVLKPIPITNDNQIRDTVNKVTIINCVVPSVGGPAGIACAGVPKHPTSILPKHPTSILPKHPTSILPKHPTSIL
ncbi:MAG: hypothetical protein WBE68_11600, partial [Candidatus Nitrosopolaris sp.]